MYFRGYRGVRNVYSGLQSGRKCIFGATEGSEMNIRATDGSENVYSGLPEGSEMYILGYRGVRNVYSGLQGQKCIFRATGSEMYN